MLTVTELLMFSLIERQDDSEKPPLSRYPVTCDTPTVIPVMRHTHTHTHQEGEIYIIRGKQAAAVSQGVNCFIKMIIRHCDKLTDGGSKVHTFRYKCLHASTAKNSLSLVCSIFCSLIHFIRCLLSSCLERKRLERCERKVKIRANNEHFCLNKRTVNVEYI